MEIPLKSRNKPPSDPAIPLLDIYPEETKTEKDTCTPMFIAALFTIARTWNKPRCPSTGEWIKKLWYLYTMEYSVQSLSRVWLSATPWIAARQASLSITNSQSLLKLMFIESVMPSTHLILCRPLLLLPPIPPSVRVFSNESTLHMRCPKYWSFSFSISPSSEHPGLISFRMDWLDQSPCNLLNHKKEPFRVSSNEMINLESIIQSEVSQKEKDKYCIPMHIYGI